MQFYKPRHFKVQEFVPPATYKVLGNRAIILISYNILKTADAIREWFNRPVKINDWCFGGKLKYRGYRPCGCPVGAKYSQHKIGAAIDFEVQGMAAEAVRRELVANSSHFLYITAIEKNTPTWVHVDCRPIVDGPVLF